MFAAYNKGCRGGSIRWLIALRTAAGWPKFSPAIFLGGRKRGSGEQIADAYGIDDQSFPESFSAQMLYPFRR
jgi:hypothetical protein